MAAVSAAISLLLRVRTRTSTAALGNQALRGLHEMGADIGDFPAGKLGLLLVEIIFNLFGSENINIEMIGLTLDGPIPSEYEKTFDRTMVAQLIFKR